MKVRDLIHELLRLQFCDDKEAVVTYDNGKLIIPIKDMTVNKDYVMFNTSMHK
jgi:hypothetical protein